MVLLLCPAKAKQEELYDPLHRRQRGLELRKELLGGLPLDAHHPPPGKEGDLRLRLEAMHPLRACHPHAHMHM
jgi:hypothetical protein